MSKLGQFYFQDISAVSRKFPFCWETLSVAACSASIKQSDLTASYLVSVFLSPVQLSDHMDN